MDHNIACRQRRRKVDWTVQATACVRVRRTPPRRRPPHTNPLDDDHIQTMTDQLRGTPASIRICRRWRVGWLGHQVLPGSRASWSGQVLAPVVGFRGVALVGVQLDEA
jgi:hypothetical protein